MTATRQIEARPAFWRLALAFGVMFAGPLFGLIGGLWLCWDYEGIEAAAHAPPLASLCWRLPFQWTIANICGDYQHAVILATASAGVIAAFLALAGLIVLAGVLARRSEAFLIAVFPPAARAFVIAAALVILVQGALVAYAAFTILPDPTLQLMLPLAAIWGAIAAAFLLLRNAVSVFRVPPLKYRGAQLSRGAQPRLWSVADDIARDMEAPRPANIVAGLNGDFFAADVPIAISDDTTLTGETLYLPLPQLRVLDIGELRAVIAHELAHFKGGETQWGKRLAPVMMALEELYEHATQRGFLVLAMLPAGWLMSLFVVRFSRAIVLHQRRRELEADRQAAAVTSGGALAAGLVRLISVDAVRRALEKARGKRKLNAQEAANICDFFVHWVKDHAAKRDPAAFLAKMSAARLPHPTDEHPPLRDRFAALGIDPPGDVAWLELPPVPATTLLDDAETLERQLSAEDTAFFGDFLNQPLEPVDSLLTPKRAPAPLVETDAPL